MVRCRSRRFECEGDRVPRGRGPGVALVREAGVSQGTVFLESEADRWFERNRRALEHFDPGADVPLRLLELYGMRPKRVVELGASNGFRVAAIQERYGTRAVAVEPSRKAIDDGKRRYPAVEFHQALASAT